LASPDKPIGIWEARYLPHLASVIDGEVVTIFLPYAEGVVAVHEIESDEIVAWARDVSQVFERLARHVEVGIIVVGFAEVDSRTPLVGAGFGTRNVRDT
jgi:hypothetical protein